MKPSSSIAAIAKELASAVNTIDLNPVVVFNAHITALAVARSLGQRGVPVVALDHDPRGLAFYSKYVKARATCPNPLTSESELINFLLELGQHFRHKSVLLPCMDEWVLAVAKNRATLSSSFAIPYPQYSVVDALLNKAKLYETASKLDIPIPITYDFTGLAAEKVAEVCPYPLVLKPHYKRDFYDKFHASVIRVNDRSEFPDAYAKAREFPMLLQEVVPLGPRRLFTFGSYVSRNGALAGDFVGRRLEIFPPGFGTTCLVETVDIPELREQGFRLLKELGYWGISEVEFIQDERDGKFKLLDVNARPWKWIGLAPAAGVDIPLMAYLDALGKPSEPTTGKPNVGWVYVKDYVQLLKQRREIDPTKSLSKDELLTLVKSRLSGYEQLAFGVYDPDDPGPFEKLTESPENWDEDAGGYYCPC